MKNLIKIPLEEKLNCQNGGTYIKSKCQCTIGYKGLLCEERICLNDGLSSSGKCICSPNYQGEQCELELKCPICRNNGRCINGKCLCTKEFIGQYCEIDIRLIQKHEKRIISIELIIVLTFLILFISILIILSYLFYKYTNQKRKQLIKIRQINLEKIWTIENSSTNIFKETNDKLPEKKDINLKLKQIDIQASLV